MPLASMTTGAAARWNYARTLYTDTGATLDDLREAVEAMTPSGSA